LGLLEDRVSRNTSLVNEDDERSLLRIIKEADIRYIVLDYWVLVAMKRIYGNRDVEEFIKALPRAGFKLKEKVNDFSVWVKNEP